LLRRSRSEPRHAASDRGHTDSPLTHNTEHVEVAVAGPHVGDKSSIAAHTGPRTPPAHGPTATQTARKIIEIHSHRAEYVETVPMCPTRQVQRAALARQTPPEHSNWVSAGLRPSTCMHLGKTVPAPDLRGSAETQCAPGDWTARSPGPHRVTAGWPCRFVPLCACPRVRCPAGCHSFRHDVDCATSVSAVAQSTGSGTVCGLRPTEIGSMKARSRSSPRHDSAIRA
jgi:hypothetical protein